MERDYRTTHSFPVFRAVGAPRKSALNRFLSIFADVRAGESGSALLLAFAGFALLTAYYILKPVREALILSESGAVTKAYASAAQAALLLLIIPAYGALASRVNRRTLLTVLMLFFIANLAAFFVGGRAGARVGVAFYIWIGIFNYFSIGQLWAFANDVYTEAEGKRLFPVVGAGLALGARAGAHWETRTIKLLGPYVLMLIGAALIGAMIVLVRIVHARAARKPVGKQHEIAQQPIGPEGGFRLIFKDRYLLLIAIMMVVLNCVNTTGEFIMGSFVQSAATHAVGAGDAAKAARSAWIGGFYGSFYTWQNLLSTALQLFAVSRIFHYIGVRGALFIMPFLAMTGYGLMATIPVLALVRTVKVLENSTDYSVQNTARQALFLPTSRAAKYKAKAAIDTFFTRFGDMFQAGVVFAGTQLSLSLAGYAAFNFALTIVWLAIVWRLAREYGHRTQPAERAAA